MMGNDIDGVFNGGSETFTVSVWVYPDASGMNSEYDAIVSHAEDSENGNFSIGIRSDGNVEVYVKNPCGDNVLGLGEGEIQPGDWHHIAVTFTSGNVSAYLDGNVYNDQTCGSTMVEAGDAVSYTHLTLPTKA